MSFQQRWHAADSETKYKIKENAAFKSRIQKLSKSFWREETIWVAKIKDERHEYPSYASMIESLMEANYGIKVRITDPVKMAYEKLEGSQPILQAERFADAYDEVELNHIRELTRVDWTIIHQVLSKAAYNRDPNLQVPAAKVVLDKLNKSVKAKTN